MADARMLEQMTSKDGFIAALDQSGGSTPGALRLYGVPETAYNGDKEMYEAVHAMRVRIMSSPAFSGAKVLGAILFEMTMDGQAHGLPVPTYLWEKRGVVPFLKVDKGLATEADGVQLMKPMPDLDPLLARAVKLGVFGTKMRSVIHHANPVGVKANVDQQFDVGLQIAKHGLVPIIEPEVSIKAPDKVECEALLRDAILKRLDALPGDVKVMLKLTIPTKPDYFLPLVKHPKIIRVVALSGGYSRSDACKLLAQNHGMIASFSRALAEGLKHSMTEAEFDKALGASIDEIYGASKDKLAA